MPRATLTIGKNLDGKVRVTRYVGEGGIGSLYEGNMGGTTVSVQAAPAEFIKLYQSIGVGRSTPPRSLDPQTPPELEQAIMYALVQDPARRYPSAEHMIHTPATLAQPASTPAPAGPMPARAGADTEGVAAQNGRA